MIPVYLADSGDGRGLRTAISHVEPENGKIIVTGTIASTEGLWNTVSATGASTNIVAQAVPGSAIVITDLVVSSEKKPSSTILIRFTDGTNTKVILGPDIINNPVNLAWSPRGYISGWVNARLDFITDATFNATVTVGYYLLSEGLEYADWLARRTI